MRQDSEREEKWNRTAGKGRVEDKRERSNGN